MDSFEFIWINILRTIHEDIGPDIFTTNSRMSLSARSKSWKHTELTRIRKEKLDHFKPIFESIQKELTNLKNIVKMYLDASEANHFPIQFFNIDIEKIEHQKAENKKHLECERNELEKEFLMTTTQIARIQKNLIDGFQYSQIRIRKLSNDDLFIDNYPLTHLDGKISSDDIMDIFIANPDLFQRICKLEPWMRCNVLNNNELKWFESSVDVCSDGIERFTADATKIIDLQLNTLTSWPNDFTSALANFDDDIHDVTNENNVNVHNIRIYVRVLLNIFKYSGSNVPK